ncbi:hypothetical protein CEXT_162141 [Caerostris extrusa]|uniref:Uncharacterized protein n=1 Tax=Caerostris extrusa TaxID=172846 RepID=A0AAV4NLI3_CAEEX|nr:hypothetical protein CEXT_162141 [Caerostris extrusa]
MKSKDEAKVVAFGGRFSGVCERAQSMQYVSNIAKRFGKVPSDAIFSHSQNVSYGNIPLSIMPSDQYLLWWSARWFVISVYRGICAGELLWFFKPN